MMIDVLLSILVGVVLLIVLLFLALQGPPEAAPDASAMAAVGHMVSYRSAPFVRGERLLDDGEYRMLRSNPVLHPVATQLRRDRRALVLLWIASLVSDLKALWHFRRFLIQHGAPSQPREELRVLGSFLMAVTFLHVVRVSVVILGPFVFANTTLKGHQLVNGMSHAAARLLGCIPSAHWPELERAWLHPT